MLVSSDLLGRVNNPSAHIVEQPQNAYAISLTDFIWPSEGF
jgi:hypothetical protein